MLDLIKRLNEALEGRYEIERQLGEGGMALVYLATDRKHDRKVALKVLKPELAAVVGAERFLAEIKTTANLQHPHILPLYDSGEADGLLFYVMPYVEGESLRDRLNREKQLPVDDATRIAEGVAEALSFAHRQGVVHRDIKPANILLLDGNPVVADFGIALAVREAGGARLTETGLSLGTPYYMSPEQATGDQVVGPPADIYSLGCVLYETLVGAPPFTGSTAQAVLGRIVTGAADRVRGHRGSVPEHVEGAVARSLEKVPGDRFSSAGEFRRALGDPSFRWGQEVADVAPAAPGYWRAAAIGLAALAAILALGMMNMRRTPTSPTPSLQYALHVPPELPSREWIGLAPDASFAVLVYPDEALRERLWLWDFRSGTRSVVEGVEGWPIDPVVSPDGREVMYFDNGDGTLRVSSLEGGVTRTLSSDSRCCGRWGDDGFIYFQGAEPRNIRRVPAIGGAVEEVTQLLAGEVGHTYFHLLPGGDAGVVTIEGDSTVVAVITLATGERSTLAEGMRSYYTESGHLVFASPQGQLMAAPFDSRRLELISVPVPIVDDVATTAVEAKYVLADDGSLLYWQDQAQGALAQFVWVHRDGTVYPPDPGSTFRAGDANQASWSLSPDGRRVAFRVEDEADRMGSILVRDLDDGSVVQLAGLPGDHRSPVFTANGDSVLFASTREADGFPSDIMVAPADGRGDPRTVLETDRGIVEILPSPAGEWLVFRTSAPTSRDIFAIRPGLDTAVTPFAAHPDIHEESPVFSPDGEWLAYTSDESGSRQVVVRRFPEVEGGVWTFDPGEGACCPRWSRDGSEIFLARLDSLVSARVQTAPSFRVTEFNSVMSWPRPPGQVTANFPFVAQPSANGWYGQHPDDGRFLALANSDGFSSQRATRELILVPSFSERLAQLLPN